MTSIRFNSPGPVQIANITPDSLGRATWNKSTGAQSLPRQKIARLTPVPQQGANARDTPYSRYTNILPIPGEDPPLHRRAALPPSAPKGLRPLSPGV